MFLGCISLSAQKKISIIPKIGINLSKLTNVDNDWKSGMNIGCAIEYQLVHELSLESGLFYSRLGAENINEDERVRRKNIEIDYIMLPILAKVYCYKNLNAYIGPQLGYKLRYSHSPSVEVVSFDKSKVDLCGVFGLGYKFNSGLIFSASYIAGLTNLEQVNAQIHDDAPVIYSKSKNRNSAFQFNVGWHF